MNNKPLDQIQKPTLLLNENRARRNIAQMADKAQRNGVIFRPHFKTHQSAAIGEWFRDAGINQITVSSVDMAAYFVEHGWTDITIAFPVNIRQIEEIEALASRCRLNILVESVKSVERVGKLMRAPLGVWIKIDVGYGRTGIRWGDIDRIDRTAQEIGNWPQLNLQGLLTHSGHTYHARSPAEIVEIYASTVDRLGQVRLSLQNELKKVLVSIGDTPSCCLVDDFETVDEIRPGNFVFFDLTQERLGVCKEEDIAVAVACPVVSKHPERSQIVIYGGAIHLSKEYLSVEEVAKQYGKIALLNDQGWSKSDPESWLLGISQEHGIIQASRDLYSSVEVGQLIAVIPVHSCLTANLLGSYTLLDGRTFSMAELR